MLNLLKSLSVLCLFVAAVCPAMAQDQAPRTNPAPLERPRPLATAVNAEPLEVLDRITEALKAAGYSFDSTDRKTFTIDARQNFERRSPKDYDRVILWLGRDAGDPKEITVYLLHGRYV